MFRPNPSPILMHPCHTYGCKCPVTLLYTSDLCRNSVYEVQTDNYKCGPVAIINSLHLYNRSPGRSMRRYIISACNTQQTHTDGFHGTRPENMHKVIMNVWPTSERYTSVRDCVRAIRSPRRGVYIVLYSYLKGEKQFYHYTVLHKGKDAYVTVNDGSDRELKWTFHTFIDEHLVLEGTDPITYPQIWHIH